MDKEKEVQVEEWFGNNNIIHHLNKNFEKAPEHHPYSFEYWIYRLASLCKGEGRDGYDFMLIKNIYNACRDFAWSYGDWLTYDYACNPSESNDKDNHYKSTMTLPELCERNLRFAAFKQPSDSAFWSDYFANDQHRSHQMETFANKQRTATFISADAFAADAQVIAPESATALKRSVHVRTSETRKAFKALVRTIRPLLKDKACARQARELYRELYNFTNLDWYFTKAQ